MIDHDMDLDAMAGMDDAEFDNDGDTDIEPDFDDSMDGDHASALASAGFGTDEDYGGVIDDDSYFEHDAPEFDNDF